MKSIAQDTIAAQATPAGKGGVGVIRISGDKAVDIAKALLDKLPKPRVATLGVFKDDQEAIIDEGIALYFPKPHSFTGEDVLELQGHGGPIVMDSLLQRVLSLGVRMAEPGEFSMRAFLNDKMDLTQAEAIADLIDAQSHQAARLAVRSLQGEFSTCIHDLVERVTHLRMYVEAALDFPEEEINFLADAKVGVQLTDIVKQLDTVMQSAMRGSVLRQGMQVVIAGKPNAGKSSLLNALSGQDSAIVTDIPGTTRDILKEYIAIDGMPLHVIDTAGLRETDDVVEKEGVSRAKQQIEQADCVLVMVDVTTDHSANEILAPHMQKSVVVFNKIDLTKQKAKRETIEGVEQIYCSAKTGEGVDFLREVLKERMGYDADASENSFIARRRHLDALDKASIHMQYATQQLANGELLAEELKCVQVHLGAITGEVRPDDLLGEIFSSFCIGK